jgi:RNA polymerase sigma-70 factor (ECF subfamily)
MSDSRYRSQAWASFIQCYTRLFFIWFKNWGIEPSSMHDVLQETLLRVLGEIKFFERHRQGSFRAWLKALARNSWKQLVEDTERQLAQREVEPHRAQNWQRISSKLAENQLEMLFDAWATQEILEMASSQVRRRTSQEIWETYERVCLRKEPVATVAASMKIEAAQIYDRVSHVRKMIRQEMADYEKSQE